jgi:phosphatidylglycerol:prolipoprotein diacylglycerol transferase
VTLADALKFGLDPLAWTILPRIELGPLAVSPHGIGIAVGYLLGAQAMIRRSRRLDGPNESHLWNVVFWALFGAIVGARVGYVLGHLPEVTDGGRDPLGIFKVYEGGISLLGGITGGILAAVPYVRRHRMGFWRCLDMATIGLSLGIFVGRFGDLVIGDHLGKPTDFVLGWRCLGEVGGVEPIAAGVYRQLAAQGTPPSLGCYDVTVHQTALYDLLSTALLFAFLVWLGRHRLRTGAMSLTFGVWYGTMRVITDFLRVDRRYFGLTGSQILAGAVVLTAAFLLLRYRGVPARWVGRGGEPATPVTESHQERPDTA